MEALSRLFDELKERGISIKIDENHLIVYGNGQNLDHTIADTIINFAPQIADSFLEKKTSASNKAILEEILKAHPEVDDYAIQTEPSMSPGSHLTAYVIEKIKNHTEKILFSLFYFGGEPYSNENKYELYLQAAKFADKHNFEAIWTPERHFDPIGGLYPNPSVLSAALASITDRIKLRAGSVVLPLHDCLRVAEEWAVVDNISNGRVGLAIASGWHVRDFSLAPECYSSRKEVMFNGIETLKKLWKGDEVKRRNGNNNEIMVKVYPAPKQNNLPLWITAANNPATFVEAGRLGTNVLTHLLDQTIDQLSEKIQLYKKSLHENGHDPSCGKVTVMLHTFVGDDLEKTIDYARPHFLKYMQGHISLILSLFGQNNVPIESLAKEDLDAMAEFAFQRYLNSASLIGTPESTSKVIDALIEVDVDEVACLIDWIHPDAALNGLAPLNALKSKYAKAFLKENLFCDRLKRYTNSLMPHSNLKIDFIKSKAIPRNSCGDVDFKHLHNIKPENNLNELFRIILPTTSPTEEVEVTI